MYVSSDVALIVAMALLLVAAISIGIAGIYIARKEKKV
jgi:hypothetical protein